MAKHFLRKASVAARYGVNVRTLERMVEDGRVPPPHHYNGRFPLWLESSLDEAERAAALRPLPKTKALAEA